MAEEGGDKEVEEQEAEHLGTRKSVALILSSLLGPALCVAFVRFRGVFNSFVVSYGATVEFTSYAVISALLFGVLKSNVIRNSAEASITIVCRLFEKLHGEKKTWATETLRKFAPALGSISQGILFFLLVNFGVNAIPDSCSWEVPHLLRFCDLNGDGTLDASEIENMCYSLTSRLLGCYIVWQVARLINDIRQPPSTTIPENAKGPLAVYLRGIQRLRRRQRRRQGEQLDESERYDIALWFADVGVRFLIWLGCGLGWVRCLGIPLSAVATALAPLGIGGLAFSLASKNIVENFISGILMFANRAFVVGDEIQSLDGKIEGVVSKVGMINTELLRLNGEPLVMPNNKLVNSGIVNLQRRNFWLIDVKIPLYMPTFENLGEVVQKMDDTLKEKVASNAIPRSAVKSISVYEEPVCFFEGFGHQGATIKVRAYVDGTLARHRFYEVRSEVLLALNDVAFSFKGAGVGFEAHILSGDTAAHGGGHGGHDHGHGHESGQEQSPGGSEGEAEGVVAFEGKRLSSGESNGKSDVKQKGQAAVRAATEP